MLAILLIAFLTCDGFTEYQNEIVRQQFVDHYAPQGSAVIDGLLVRNYAFTDQGQLLTYIDAARFQCCPNSFLNTVVHEVHHLNGRQHNPAYVKDDPMSYSITIRQNGDVVEDNFVLPPLLPSQPWAAQILAPSPTVMRTVPIRKKPLLLPYAFLIPRNSSEQAGD
jgi:hypothetical protein